MSALSRTFERESRKSKLLTFIIYDTNWFQDNSKWYTSWILVSFNLKVNVTESVKPDDIVFIVSDPSNLF